MTQSSDPTASHSCWAYVVGDQYRCSDDGEPSGTAGKPMLSAIQSEGLDQVCVLVVRFFGGTKLGAGGLVRAYGGAARQCLQEAPRVFMPTQVRALGQSWHCSCAYIMPLLRCRLCISCVCVCRLWLLVVFCDWVATVSAAVSGWKLLEWKAMWQACDANKAGRA